MRKATRFGPAPPQSGVFGLDALADDGDDWLTVNVWSPDLSGGLPLMVWIQGGAYMFGMSGLPEYDGTNLALGGVVLVTFNYRVGLEGFGYVEGTPANRGLLDQVAARKWVQRNISAGGGDPDRVTIFGQSAGGGSVAALLAMPRAAGLFHRAIAQSVPGAYFTPELAADVTQACASELGLEPAELSTVDPRLLPAAGDAICGGVGTVRRRASHRGRAHLWTGSAAVPGEPSRSRGVRHAWTAFATNGDPGWPTHDTGLTRLFDIEPVVTAYPEQVSREIWRDHPNVLDLA